MYVKTGIKMKKISLLLTLLAGLMSSHANSSDICSDAAKELDAATKVYQKSGNTEFIKRLLKNGPLEDDKRSLGQGQILSQLEQFYGKFLSASVVSRRQLGDRSCYMIGILEYQNGPAFVVANYYKGTKGIGAVTMSFRTKPEELLPKEFLVQ